MVTNKSEAIAKIVAAAVSSRAIDLEDEGTRVGICNLVKALSIAFEEADAETYKKEKKD